MESECWRSLISKFLGSSAMNEFFNHTLEAYEAEIPSAAADDTLPILRLDPRNGDGGNIVIDLNPRDAVHDRISVDVLESDQHTLDLGPGVTPSARGVHEYVDVEKGGAGGRDAIIVKVKILDRDLSA